MHKYHWPRLAWANAVLAGFALGCGPETMPKGTGASGTVAQTVAEDDLGLELINRLNEPQQRSLQWLSRPFDQAATVNDDLSDEQRETVEKIKENWDKVFFADPDRNPPNGAKIVHLARIETNLGDIEFHFTSDFTPDHVRSFLHFAQQGLLDGKPFSVGENVLWLGAEDEKPLYYLEPAAYINNFRQGVMFMPDEGDKAAGTRFGITLVDDFLTSDNATAFAGTTPSADVAALERIANALKEEPGSVKIERVRISAPAQRLFREDGVSLPSVGEDGRPRVTAEGIPVDLLKQSPSE